MNNLKKNLILTPFNILYKINPELDLKILFRMKLGYPLNINNPKTFNEKLQWIKLYDKNQLMPKCCDKYTVRKHIENKGYKYILNELLWEGFNPMDIPFDALPDKFVIKVTHGSTFNIIVKDKNKLNKDDVIKKCQKWLKAKFIPCYGEWFYGLEKPRIIVEKFIESSAPYGILDYKFFCFNGKVKCIYVSTSKEEDDSYCIDYYDANWNLMNLRRTGHKSLGKIEKPKGFEEMKKIAEDLSKDFLHVRVDFFYENEKIYFGEMTFTTSAGFGKIDPFEYDVEMGSWLDISKKDEKVIENL